MSSEQKAIIENLIIRNKLSKNQLLKSRVGDCSFLIAHCYNKNKNPPIRRTIAKALDLIFCRSRGRLVFHGLDGFTSGFVFKGRVGF